MFLKITSSIKPIHTKISKFHTIFSFVKCTKFLFDYLDQFTRNMYLQVYLHYHFDKIIEFWLALW
jgi:hypothetical protein